jgi:hypothetical protein
MVDEPKTKWLNWLAITTIIFSACATLSTFKGSSFSTKSILAQANASNTWAYFQSKSVKQHAYELQRDVLELQVLSVQGEQAETCKAKIEEYNKEIKRYDGEKAQAMIEARAFEQTRADFQMKSASFGMAVVYLQVAIMFSTKEYLWVPGIGVVVIGFINIQDALWHIIS